MFKLAQLDHVALSVGDLARSAEWYRAVLGLERRFQEVWGDVPVMMCVGNTCLALFPANSQQPGSSQPEPRLAMRHVAFRADAPNFLAAQAELRILKIPFSFEDHKIAHSIYFNDPDGHKIEITTYLEDHLKS